MSKESKIKKLFEQSMENGGLPAFRNNWEQSIGIVTDEDGVKSFNPEKREVEYKDFEIGRNSSLDLWIYLCEGIRKSN